MEESLLLQPCSALPLRKTLPSWASLKELLSREGEAHLPLDRALRGELWPACWDSPALALNLAHACSGFPGDGALHKGGTAALKSIRDLRKVSENGVQRAAMGPLLSALYPPCLEPLLVKRLSGLFPGDAVRIRGTDWSAVFSSMRQLSPHPAMCVVKSYLNAWATSVRFHEDRRLSCVLGCADSEDSMVHYMKCDRLWQIVNDSVRGGVASDSLGRLAISAPTSGHLLNLAVCFSTYHAIKVSERTLVLEALDSGSFDRVSAAARGYARVAACSLGHSKRQWGGGRNL